MSMKKNLLADNMLNINNGFKDQERSSFWSIQFFDINNNNDEENENISDLNKINIRGNKIDSTLFTRQISGLPTLSVADVTDVMQGGIVNVIPSNLEDPSGTITSQFVVTKNKEGIKPFIKRFFRLFYTQVGLDDAVAQLDRNGNIVIVTDEEQQMKQNIVDNMDKEFTSNEKIFFKMVVTSHDFTSKDPLTTYIFYNTWIKSFSIHESFTPTATDPVRANLTFRYDYPRIIHLNK